MKIKTNKYKTIVKDFMEHIGNLNLDELNGLIIYANNLTVSNCWWAEYQLRDFISNVAKEEIRIREKDSSNSSNKSRNMEKEK